MENSGIKLTFLGATGMVTGSKTLVETETMRLLVDYGAFQEETLDIVTLNKKLPPSPETIDYLILTHGHLDHCGMVPYLVKKGFRGIIYGSAPTLDIARLIMADSARIQEFEAKKMHQSKAGARREKKGKGKKDKIPFNPRKENPKSKDKKHAYYFGEADVVEAYDLMVEVEPDQWIDLQDGSRFRLQYNGHIIGSTFVELETAGKTVVFSGDIGREDDRLMYPPKKPEKADIVVIEGTYGDRDHPKNEAEPLFEKIVDEVWRDHATLLIPSFAVERTQVIMDILYTLHEQGKLPPIPVYVDSPMGISVLRMFHDHPKWHKLDNKRNMEMSETFTLVKEAKFSRRIVEDEESKVVIAGSGMLTGGRILNYLKKYVRFPNTRILLVGYQGEETTGRYLQEGRDLIVVDDKQFKVNAKILEMNFLSAHADRTGLMDWLSGIKNKPQMVLINHSDPEVAPKFAEHITEKFGWKASVPVMKKPLFFP